MKKKVLGIFKYIIFLSIGLIILYLVYQQQETAYQAECGLRNIAQEDCSLIKKLIEDFKSANYFWILLVLLAFTLSNVSRAIRWNMLLKPLGYTPRFINSFLAIMLGYFANLGLPRMGELVRAGTIARYEKIPAEKAMGTIVTDRIIDVISIFIVTGMALLFEYDKIGPFLAKSSIGETLSGIGNLLLYMAILFVAAVSLFWVFRKKIMATALFQKLKQIGLSFWEGIKSVGKLDKPGLFIFHSIIIWLMYFMMTYLCFFAFAPTAHLPMVAGLVVFVFGSWGVVFPSPGGMGTYHFMVMAALGIYGISGDDGFAWANIAFFSIQLGINVFIGLIALLTLPWINRQSSLDSGQSSMKVKQ